MSEFKFNFINWRPDFEEFNNDGLVTADNVLHDTEGYKEVRAATNNSVYGSVSRSVMGMVCKPIGTSGQQLAAWVNVATGPPITGTLNLGFGEAGPSLRSISVGETLSGINTIALVGLQVAELGDKVFAVARSKSLLQGGTLVSTDIAGFFTITSG